MATENVEDKKSIGERDTGLSSTYSVKFQIYSYKKFHNISLQKKGKNVWDDIFGTLLIYFISARSHKKIEGKA